MKKIFLLFCTTSCLVACKKEESKSRTDLLTSGKWTVTQNMNIKTASLAGTSIVDTTDNYANSRACERDNTVMFERLGTITIDEGPTKCNQSDPQTKSGGNWALVDNERKLRWNPDNFTADFTITELTDNRLRLFFDTTGQLGTNGAMANVKVYVTFTK